MGEKCCTYIRALVIVNQVLMSQHLHEEQAQNWLYAKCGIDAHAMMFMSSGARGACW